MEIPASEMTTRHDFTRGETMDGVVMLIARVLVAQIFIIAGIRKLLSWDATIHYMGAAHLPMADVLIYAVVLLEIGGGLLLLLGWHTRQIAGLLAAFTVLAALFFHQFWAVPDAQYAGQLNNFLKNIAMTGGLLMFVVHGGGKLAADRQ